MVCTRRSLIPSVRLGWEWLLCREERTRGEEKERGQRQNERNRYTQTQRESEYGCVHTEASGQPRMSFLRNHTTTFF